MGGQSRAPAGMAGQWLVQEPCGAPVLSCPASICCFPGSLEAIPHADLLLGLEVSQAQEKAPLYP